MRPRLLITALACAAPTLAVARCPTTVDALTLDLPGFASPAALTRPGKTAPKALVVLVHGSGPYDMDASQLERGVVVSQLLRRLAESLSCDGYATIRYNKRYVRDARTVDQAAFETLTMQDMAQDARLAADEGFRRLGRANLPVVYLGWSEGSAVAAAAAADDQRTRAFIGIGPIATASVAETTSRMVERTGLPYLQRYARDGRLTPGELDAAEAGPGGPVAQMFVRMSRGPTGGVNPGVDRDRDGAVDVVTEAAPTFRSWFAPRKNAAGQGVWADGKALPGLAVQAPRIHAPILLLQGLEDGNIDPDLPRALAAAYPRQITLRAFAGLGHTLGPAVAPDLDRFLPPEPKALRAISAWLDKVLKRRP